MEVYPLVNVNKKLWKDPPLVNVKKKLWKDPPFKIGKSTISMVHFQ